MLRPSWQGCALAIGRALCWADVYMSPSAVALHLVLIAETLVPIQRFFKMLAERFSRRHTGRDLGPQNALGNTPDLFFYDGVSSPFVCLSCFFPSLGRLALLSVVLVLRCAFCVAILVDIRFVAWGLSMGSCFWGGESGAELFS